MADKQLKIPMSSPQVSLWTDLERQIIASLLLRDHSIHHAGKERGLMPCRLNSVDGRMVGSKVYETLPPNRAGLFDYLEPEANRCIKLRLALETRIACSTSPIIPLSQLKPVTAKRLYNT